MHCFICISTDSAVVACPDKLVSIWIVIYAVANEAGTKEYSFDVSLEFCYGHKFNKTVNLPCIHLAKYKSTSNRR